MGNEKPKRISLNAIRICVLSAVLVVAVLGAVFGLGNGNLSSMGWGAIAYLCPLGALEGMLGSWAFVPRALIALAAVIVLALLVGRAFCSWACPVPPLRRLLRTKKQADAEEEERKRAADVAIRHYEADTEPPRSGKLDLDSRHIVLCGALGSAAIFGFPVFCLVCPIGLTFAVVVGLVRLIGFNEPSWGLLVFAGILALELLFLRKWCSKICPVGALLSLLGKANRTFRPKADPAKCLRATEGMTCGACAAACPELLDPQGDRGIRSIDDCTRCGKCADACPTSAIEFPLLGGVKATTRPDGSADVAEEETQAIC